MVEEKKKKKKLTLNISSGKTPNISNYAKSSGKTSVVIEKKPQRRWGEKKFQPPRLQKQPNKIKPKSKPPKNQDKA